MAFVEYSYFALHFRKAFGGLEVIYGNLITNYTSKGVVYCVVKFLNYTVHEWHTEMKISKYN